MKLRMIVVTLVLSLVAWLPAVAQQSTAEKAPEKSACACCQHDKEQGKEATAAQASKTCCHGKQSDAATSKSCCEGKEMACCKKDGKDNQAAINCCAGKDGKMCANKHGKGCCGNDAMACNGKDAKNCCAGHACCSGATQS